MSISPQSLARTRDKRSLRIPRKFEDFSLVTSSEIPPEVPREKTYKHFADALKMKGKSTRRHTVAEESNASEHSKTPDISKIADTSSPEITTEGDTTEITSDDIDLECKETTPSASELLIKTKEDEFGKVLNDEKVHNDSAENISILNVIRRGDDNVIKKSPFHPSITISNGVRLSGPSSKPLVEKKPSTVSILTPPTDSILTPTTEPIHTLTSESILTPPTVSIRAPPTSSSTTSKSSSRKKSKGFSLMVKPPANGTPLQSNINCSQQQVQPQQTKYYNNLTQNMQYGTRLMLNEPIYLPRSVATIPPITTTLQQIANQARKPPFLSKKSGAYYAYQEERKFSYMMSNYTALVKITKHLEFQDLLNLRLVNKSWKSIIDCEAVWKKVAVKSSTIPAWGLFVKNILLKYHTSDLILDEYKPDGATQPILEALVKTKLRRIWIKTVDDQQNRFAMELICGLHSVKMQVRIIWKVKVVVDDKGLALVPIGCQGDPKILDITVGHQKPKALYYCYQVCPELLNNSNDTTLVELGDLEDLFNQEAKDVSISSSKSPHRTRIDVKPI